MPLWAILTAVLALSGVVFVVVAWMGSAPALARFRIRPEHAHKVVGPKLWGRVLGNMAMSGATVFALSYAAAPWIIDADATMTWRGVVHAAAILLAYDLAYYAMHRFAFHRTTWLKRVHAVHHVIRAPTAVESLYLHPVETFAGQLLLTLTVATMGPVAPVTYGLIVAVHATLNIIVHAGLDIPAFGLRALSALSRKHAAHHISMRGGNYASLTPLWDVLFGTAE